MVARRAGDRSAWRTAESLVKDLRVQRWGSHRAVARGAGAGVLREALDVVAVAAAARRAAGEAPPRRAAAAQRGPILRMLLKGALAPEGGRGDSEEGDGCLLKKEDDGAALYSGYAKGSRARGEEVVTPGWAHHSRRQPGTCSDPGRPALPPTASRRPASASS